jgi:hypothetical protein
VPPKSCPDQAVYFYCKRGRAAASGCASNSVTSRMRADAKSMRFEETVTLPVIIAGMLVSGDTVPASQGP